MFFTNFRRNLTIKPFKQHFIVYTIFSLFFFAPLFLITIKSFADAVFKIFGFILISTFAGAFLTWMSIVIHFYYNKFDILIAEKCYLRWINWYANLKIQCNPPLKRDPLKLLPKKILLGLIYAFGPWIYFYYEFIVDFLNQFIRSTVPEQFPLYQSLPHSFQKRFLELQTPANQYFLIQANPKWLLQSTKNRLIVDSFVLDLKNLYQCWYYLQRKLNIEAEMLLDNFVYPDVIARQLLQPWKYLNLKLLETGPLETQIQNLQRIIPRNSAIFSSLSLNEFPTILKNCNLSNISRLEIVYSDLSKNDLSLIKSLRHLKFIRLCLKNKEEIRDPKYVKFVLNCLQGISNIKLYFDHYYGNNDNYMEELLVSWILKHDSSILNSLFVTFRYFYDQGFGHPQARNDFVTFASEKVYSFKGFNRYK